MTDLEAIITRISKESATRVVLVQNINTDSCYSVFRDDGRRLVSMNCQLSADQLDDLKDQLNRDVQISMGTSYARNDAIIWIANEKSLEVFVPPFGPGLCCLGIGSRTRERVLRLSAERLEYGRKQLDSSEIDRLEVGSNWLGFRHSINAVSKQERVLKLFSLATNLIPLGYVADPTYTEHDESDDLIWASQIVEWGNEILGKVG